MSTTSLILYTALVGYIAYSVGHYRGVLADIRLLTGAAYTEGFQEGVQAGADWENNKHSLSCNGA